MASSPLWVEDVRSHEVSGRLKLDERSPRAFFAAFCTDQIPYTAVPCSASLPSAFCLIKSNLSTSKKPQSTHRITLLPNTDFVQTNVIIGLRLLICKFTLQLLVTLRTGVTERETAGLAIKNCSPTQHTCDVKGLLSYNCEFTLKTNSFNMLLHKL